MTKFPNRTVSSSKPLKSELAVKENHLVEAVSTSKHTRRDEGERTNILGFKLTALRRALVSVRTGIEIDVVVDIVLFLETHLYFVIVVLVLAALLSRGGTLSGSRGLLGRGWAIGTGHAAGVADFTKLLDVLAAWE